jgi:hypothetical protein
MMNTNSYPNTFSNIVAAGALLCLVLTQTANAYVAILNKADHTELRIVPAPGKVTIDGALNDWDLSGAILMFMDAPSKQTHQLRGAMMYDRDYLYIGGRLKDPTPMNNQYHFGGQVNMSWNADALQVFLVANPDIRSDVRFGPLPSSMYTGGLQECSRARGSIHSRNNQRRSGLSAGATPNSHVRRRHKNHLPAAASREAVLSA